MKGFGLRSTFLLLFTLFSIQIIAQTGTVRGFVYDKKTGEPIIFTNVYLKGTTFGSSTDINGLYVITKIPVGKYTIVSTYLGFDTVQSPLDLKDGDIQSKNFYLTPGAIGLGTVLIDARAEEKVTQVKVSVETVTSKEINKIASVGGEPDIAQYLQILPGVVFTGDQGGQLYIRGGSPVMNKVLLDGMVIYNPFHSIGFFSVFETDIIKTAEVYTAGFNANYGGRISAVMDVNTRDGNRKFLTGKVSVSPFASRALLEGPLGKPKEGKFMPSFILTAKNSYLEQTSKVIYPWADTSGNGLPFNFTDVYGKISFASENGSKLNLFGFRYTDRVNYSKVTSIDWKSTGAGTNFVVIPENYNTLIKGNFAYSDYTISQNEADGLPRNSRIAGFNTGLNFTYYPGKDELIYGFDIVGFQTDFNFVNSANRIIGQQQNTTELAGFIKYRISRDKIVFEPGFRMQYFSSLALSSPEPRFGFKWNISKKVRYKMAGGLYSQNLLSANSDRDVVNLFYGFLSAPSNLQKEFDGRAVTTNIQKAKHIIAGVEYDLNKAIEFNFETYLKDFNQIINVNRNKIYEDNFFYANKPDILKKDFIVESGKAYGMDFRVKYEKRYTYIWATYSLTYVTRYDGVKQYYPNFDRRHNINLVFNNSFGKDKRNELSVRWNFGSGFPFTQTQGFYEKLNFTNGIGTDILPQNGSLGILYAGLNEARLPSYHRLDASVKRTYYVGKNSELDVIVSATNVYNRNNIFYFDRVNYTRVNQLPILPSIAMSLKF